MPRLILVNGLPGSGKSTLARRYGDDHQLALALDIDILRSMLGRSLDEPSSVGLAERFLRRSEDDSRQESQAAAILLDRAGGVGALAEMDARLEHVVASRPRTRRVAVLDGDVEETYRGLCRAIASG